MAQRCGNCKWFDQAKDAGSGYCLWPMPYWMNYYFAKELEPMNKVYSPPVKYSDGYNCATYARKTNL